MAQRTMNALNLHEFFDIEDLSELAGNKTTDENIIGAFADEHIELFPVNTEEKVQVQQVQQEVPENIISAIEKLVSQELEFEQVQQVQVQEKQVQVEKKVAHTKEKESRGTLKRKVVGQGSFCETKISREIYCMNNDYDYDRVDSPRRNKRYKKKVCKGTYNPGTAHSTLIPSSAGRRLCQVICALANWNGYSLFFSQVPAIFQRLREICENDMKENNIESSTGYFTLLRATIQRALCTEGKEDDYMFIPLAKYILQEKYEGTHSMTYDKIQSLCGGLCKANKTIKKEFASFNYGKIGPSKVALSVFNVQYYCTNV